MIHALKYLGRIFFYPALVAGYLLTKNEELYYVLMLFTGIMLAVSCFYVVYAFSSIWSDIQRQQVRENWKNTPVSEKAIGYIVTCILIFFLFGYVNSFIGTMYAMSVVFVHLGRAKLMIGRL